MNTNGGISGAQLNAQVQALQAQVNEMQTRIAGLSSASTARATETYERQVRERVFSMLTATYSVEYALEATEKAVRYIVDGKGAQ